MLKRYEIPKNLFSGTLPDKFFYVLACPNQRIYQDCLFIIYRQMSHGLSFGVEKNLMTDLLQDYFEGKGGDLEEDGMVLKNNRDKATAILRKLKDYGWIIEEDSDDYQTYLNLQDYAIEILKTLYAVATNSGVEYKGYISTIYTIIQSPDSFEDKSDLLRQVYENTDALISGLKSLHSNIKKYIEQLTGKKKVKEILESVFGEYRSEVIDKAYNRLITSDNVHKFRPAIMEGLESFAHDSNFIEEAAKGFAKKNECGLGEGMEEAKDIIEQTMYAFSNLDRLLGAIKSKNARYHKSAINAALFIANNTADTIGQINTILNFIAEDYKKRDITFEDVYECPELENLFSLQSLTYIDETSLYKPRTIKKLQVEEVYELEEVEDISEDELKDELKEQMNKGINKKKIKKTIDSILEDKDSVMVSDVDIIDDLGYLNLIYTYLYADDEQIGYEIHETNNLISKGKYSFKDFEIRRKKK